MKRALLFDSGVGGLSVLDAVVAAGLPLEIDYVADNAWLPYGLRAPEALAARVPALLAKASAAFASDIVVIACNTASVAALSHARAALSLPIVGVVPPIKPAAQATKSGVIGLLATPATVQGPYVAGLIAEFAAGVQVVRYGSSGLVAAAEAKLAGQAVPLAPVREAMDGLFGAPQGRAIDVVALACTHFPLLAEELAAAGPPGCAWLDSGAAIARRVADLLQLAHGQARTVLRGAAFTDAAAGARTAPAFQARGFSAFSALGEAPDFTLRPLVIAD